MQKRGKNKKGIECGENTIYKSKNVLMKCSQFVVEIVECNKKVVVVAATVA